MWANCFRNRFKGISGSHKGDKTLHENFSPKNSDAISSVGQTFQSASKPFCLGRMT
jgi:hypothetical protein